VTIADMSRNGSGPTPEPSLADLHEPLDWRELWSTTTAEPDWLIPGILERGRLHAIYAPKKQKKSLLTLLMVASLVTGRPLLGRPNPHGRKLRVLYIDIENARDDIRQRLNDAGYGPDDLAQLTYFSFPSLPGLDSPIGGAHLLSLVERYQPDLLVLDTTSRVVTGKENDADTFRSLYRHALVPVKARRVAILRLDHAGKDVTLGQRGSSAKGDDLDTAWYLTVRGPDRLTLRLDFQRTNHHPAEIELAQHGAPLRFARIDTATDRPEVAALIARLDGLDVPPHAGRDAARIALTGAGIKVNNGVLAEAVKIRKTCPQDQRTGAPENDLQEIDFTCPDEDHECEDSQGQSCPGQVADSADRWSPSEQGRPVRDLPVSRRGQVSDGAARPPGSDSNGHVDFESMMALLNAELGATTVEQ
jgi:AAA domain-containing protein